MVVESRQKSEGAIRVGRIGSDERVLSMIKQLDVTSETQKVSMLVNHEFLSFWTAETSLGHPKSN